MLQHTVSPLTIAEFGYEVGLEGKMPYVKAKIEGGSCTYLSTLP